MPPTLPYADQSTRRQMGAHSIGVDYCILAALNSIWTVCVGVLVWIIIAAKCSIRGQDLQAMMLVVPWQLILFVFSMAYLSYQRWDVRRFPIAILAVIALLPPVLQILIVVL